MSEIEYTSSQDPADLRPNELGTRRAEFRDPEHAHGVALASNELRTQAVVARRALRFIDEHFVQPG